MEVKARFGFCSHYETAKLLLLGITIPTMHLATKDLNDILVCYVKKQIVFKILLVVHCLGSESDV